MKDVESLMQNLVQYGRNLRSLTLDRNLATDKQDKKLNGFSRLENLKFLKIRRCSGPSNLWPLNLMEILDDCKGIEELDLGTHDFVYMNKEFGFYDPANFHWLNNVDIDRLNKDAYVM